MKMLGYAPLAIHPFLHAPPKKFPRVNCDLSNSKLANCSGILNFGGAGGELQSGEYTVFAVEAESVLQSGRGVCQLERRNPSLESLKRLQTQSMRISVVVLAVGALGLSLYEVNLAKGFVLGGLAGLAGLWLLYRQTLGLAAGAEASDMQLRAFKGAFLRLPVYGAALLWALRLGEGSYHPLLAAVVGLFFVRGVLVLVALYGTSVEKETQ